MRKKHRNSQKRYYLEGYSYFLTVVTKSRFPYFKEGIFCEIFAENLRICQELKGFELHGWFLGYDHFHLLITPGGKWNISKIMQSFKRNVSHNINFILGDIEGANNYSRLQYRDMLNQFRHRFMQKYPNLNDIPFPKFQWQKSFHDHIIRNDTDFENHLSYIQWNPEKHGMPEGWRWIYPE